MNEDAVAFAGLRDTARRLASGEIASRELTETILARIDRTDTHYHAFTLRLADDALAAAHEAQRELSAGLRRGPLHGVPVAVKDLLDMAGQPTASGTTILADRVAAEDSTIVARLKRAGAVIVGKTQLTEAASGFHHPAVTAPVNPWSAAHSPGFSSSGSGVAVSAGLCFAAIGSDTGGSIRLPSSMCGITGLKTTWGRVSRHGVVPLVEYLDTLGPMARSAWDCAAMLCAIAGPDPADPTSHAVAAPNYLMTIEAGVAGKVIGYDRADIADHCDEEVAAMVELAAAVLADLGARLVEISLPSLDPDDAMALVAAGASEAHRGLYPERMGEYGPELAQLLANGLTLSARDLARALNAGDRLSARLRALFENVDMLLVPALSVVTPAARRSGEHHDPADGRRLSRYTMPFNISQSPALTLPGGFDRRGLPLGFQLVGRHFDEAGLLQAGHAYQSATDWHLRRPPAA